MTGRVCSHYRILEKLGEGGMGVVWKAEDVHIQRLVALKFLHASDDRSRLLREAQAAGSLNHPNICAVYEVDPDRGFLALELVEGESLAAKIAGRPLPVDQAVGLATQICAGLKGAHDKGIIHRDVKSGNILVTADGRAKILDFGLARVAGQPTVTREGAMAGTPGYMAPEQMRGELADRRTDIWALGAVLHEMLTGRLPMGQTETLPEGLGRVVRKALAADPRERYQHVDDMLVDLNRAGATPTPRPKRFVWPVAGMILGAIALAGWLLIPRRAAAPSWKNATFTQLTNLPSEEIYPSLSPDGRSFVFQSRASGNWDIYLQRVGSKNPINLTKDCSDDDTQPVFSPDGERIAFRSERGRPLGRGGIFMMGATGETVRRLTASGYNPAWSPDSKQIVYSTGWFWWATARTGSKYQLMVVDIARVSGSGGPRSVSEKIEDAIQPNWSPHGQRIAFHGFRGGNHDIWTVPAAGGEPIRVTLEPSVDWNPVWSPDGKHLYFSSDRGGSTNLWRIRIEEESGRVLEPAEPVTTPSSETAHFSFARDGRSMVYVNRLKTGNIYKIDFDPVKEAVVGKPSPVTQASWLAGAPDLSPNEEWLVFHTTSRPADLHVVRTDGAGLRQLTDDDFRDVAPHWSPDGKRIAFYSNRGGGPSQVWTISPDGSGLQQLTRDRRGALFPVWSPDGSRLTYNARERDRNLACIMELSKPWHEGSVEELPPPGGQASGFSANSWSPDGRKLAGVRGSAGGISVFSLDSRQYDHFTESGFFPRWLSDGRRLVYLTFATTSKSALYLLDTRSRKVRELLSATPNEFSQFVPSHDDRRIYFGLASIEADVWLMSRE